MGNTFWQFLTSLFQGKGTFLLALIIGRRLGVTELGLMASATGFASIVLQVFDMRLQEAIIRYVGHFLAQEQPRKAMAAVRLIGSLVVATGLLALLVLVLASPWATEYLLRTPRGFRLLALGGLMVIAGYYCDSLLGLMRATLAFRGPALVVGLANVSRLTGAWLVTARPGAQVEDVMLVSGVVTLLAAATLAVASWSRLRSLLGSDALQASISEIAEERADLKRFVQTSYVFALCLIPMRDLDINLLSYFTGHDVVGRYRMAKTFLAAVWLLCDAAYAAVYPELVRLWSQGQQTEMRRFLRRVALGSAVLAPLLYVAGCLAVPVALRYLLKPDFAGTGQLFAAMTWGIIPWAPLIWLAPLLQAAGRPDVLLRASIMCGLVTAATYLLVIPAYGSLGAALVFAAATPFNQYLTAFYAWRTKALAR